jgi:hypothetical protein
MQPISQRFATPAVVVLLGLVSVVGAHGHDGDMKMDMGEQSVSRPTIATISNTTDAGPQSYFQYGEHSGLLVAHILLMTIGWIFILPIGKHPCSLEFPSTHVVTFYRCHVFHFTVAL